MKRFLCPRALAGRIPATQLLKKGNLCRNLRKSRGKCPKKRLSDWSRILRDLCVMWRVRYRKRDSVVLEKDLWSFIVVGTDTEETGQRGLARNDTIVRQETELSVLFTFRGESWSASKNDGQTKGSVSNKFRRR